MNMQQNGMVSINKLKIKFLHLVTKDDIDDINTIARNLRYEFTFRQNSEDVILEFVSIDEHVPARMKSGGMIWYPKDAPADDRNNRDNIFNLCSLLGSIVADIERNRLEHCARIWNYVTAERKYRIDMAKIEAAAPLEYGMGW